MRLRSLLTIFLITWFMAGSLTAQEPELALKKVAVFPFTVLSKTPREYLGAKVREEFESRLKAEGFALVPDQDVDKEVAALKEPLDDNRAKEIGRSQGADTVITGQVVVVGEALALEARIIDVSGKQAPVVLKQQGTGVAALTGLARQMAGEAGLRSVGTERLRKIAVKGNRRIDSDAVVGVMQTREGETINAARLREDLKAIYKLGYFTDVKFDISDTPEGKVLTVIVKEKPAIHKTIIRGNINVKEKALLDAMGIKSLAVASEPIIKEAIEKALKVYREKGYYGVQIKYTLEPFTPEEVNLVFDVNEGGPVSIKEIKFDGISAFTAKELKKVIETKEKGLPIISRFTHAGKLVPDMLEQDAEKIGAFYFNHGYIKAKVGEPKIDVRGGTPISPSPSPRAPSSRWAKSTSRGTCSNPGKICSRSWPS